MFMSGNTNFTYSIPRRAFFQRLDSPALRPEVFFVFYGTNGLGKDCARPAIASDFY
jgi:hypothetical protein